MSEAYADSVAGSTSARTKSCGSSRVSLFRGETWWQLGLLGAVAAIVVWLTVVTVPWHMDEFINYHPLACREPSQKLNVYEVSCADYVTRVGPWEYQRSFEYAGAASAVLLWPFTAILNPIQAHYVVGIIALGVIVLGVVRSLGIPTRFAIVGVIFFPVAYAVLHDAGPVRIGLATMAWTPVLVRRFLVVGGWVPRCALGGILVVLWVVATEDKPFFVYLVPGIALWTLASFAAQDMWQEVLTRWRALASLLILAVSACLAFLLIATTEGQPYLFYLAELRNEFSEGHTVVGTIQSLVITFGWSFHGQRVRDYSSMAWPTAAGAIACFFLVIHLYLRPSIWLWQDRVARLRGCAALLFASAATMAVIIVNAGGWATHHFVYMQVPLLAIALLAASGTPAGALRLGAHLSVLSLACLGVMAALPPQPTASQEISVVMRSALSEADGDAVINCADWGCYFTYSLLNIDNVPVVWADDRGKMSALARRARSGDYRILQACMCNPGAVRKAYPRAHVSQIPTGTKVWHLYAVDVN